jgi:tetratricopeptide (TPR) repeat protein
VASHCSRKSPPSELVSRTVQVVSRIPSIYLERGLWNGLKELLWFGAIVFVIIFVAQTLWQDLITIEPILVPKTFSENGYTPEVASRHLSDALYNFIDEAGSSIENPNIALRGEAPNFIVPKLDLSLDTLISSLRTLLHYRSRRSISGEFTLRDKRVWLRLRIDREEVYTGLSGIDPENPDELLSAAASSVMDKIQPYLVAVALYDKDPAQAIEKADLIIVRFPESDANVQWSYVLKGKAFIAQKDYAIAESALRRAIELNPVNWAAHNNLGIALSNQGKLNDAVAEFRRAVQIDPKLQRHITI